MLRSGFWWPRTTTRCGDLVIRVLSDEGYQAIAARDGTEATRILETGEFDIVLTDVRMPGATGMDVLHQAMARHLHQPVILMTAFGTIESAVQAMRDGAYHYLAKPFDIEDLVTVVGGAARRSWNFGRWTRKARSRAGSCSRSSFAVPP